MRDSRTEYGFYSLSSDLRYARTYENQKSSGGLGLNLSRSEAFAMTTAAK